MIKDISAAKDLVTCYKRQRTQPKGRPAENRIVKEQWPRLYIQNIDKTIKAKHWELRSYLPRTINDLTKY